MQSGRTGQGAHALPQMQKCHSQEMSALHSFWDDDTENRSYSQETISTGLSSACLSLIWWWHLGLPHFPAALIVRIALSTSLFLKFAACWMPDSQEYLCQSFGPGSEEYCISPTARRSQSREMEMAGNQSAGNLNDIMDYLSLPVVPY